MSKIELPPLPPVVAHMHSNGEVCAERRPEASLWPVDLVDASEVRARDRQIVELCAALCDQYEMAKWEAYKHGHGPERASDYTQGQSDGAGDCGNAIRALLDEKKGNE